MPLNEGATQGLSAMTGNAVLIWIREDGSETRFPIIAPVTTIGREPTNMVPVIDTTVSRFHAKLVYQNGQYVLMDLGSANKTYVNGREIKEAVLTPACDIRFAGCRFKFQMLQQPAAPTPTPYPSSAQAPRAPARYPTPPQPAAAAAPPAALAAKGRPKPIIILVGVFVVLLILIVVIVKVSEKPGPSTTAPAASSPRVQNQSTPPLVAPSAASSAPSAPVGAAATEPPPATTTSGSPTTATPAPTFSLPPPPGPQDIPRLMDEAAELESSGKLRDARLRYEQVLRLDPANSRIRSKITNLKADIAKAIDLHFKNAKQAYDNLRYDEAIDEWGIVLSLAEPNDPRYIESQQGLQQAQAKLRR